MDQAQLITDYPRHDSLYRVVSPRERNERNNKKGGLYEQVVLERAWAAVPGAVAAYLVDLVAIMWPRTL
ncbi:hypothetical protein F4819DRAFT_490276 [Hypoxylon fuscum]|nr:hypothetical protein F4819DRAFT_490276 [Hypoxylon fuscum]